MNLKKYDIETMPTFQLLCYNSVLQRVNTTTITTSTLITMYRSSLHFLKCLKTKHKPTHSIKPHHLLVHSHYNRNLLLLKIYILLCSPVITVNIHMHVLELLLHLEETYFPGAFSVILCSSSALISIDCRSRPSFSILITLKDRLFSF